MWFVIPYWKVQSYVRCVTKPHKEWGWTCGAFKDNFSQNASAQWARALPEKRKKAHGPSQLSRLFHLLGNLMHHQLSRCHWLVQPIGRNRIIKEHELLILWQNTWIWLHFQAQNCQVDLSHLSFHKSFFFTRIRSITRSHQLIVAKSLKAYTCPPHTYVMDVISIWEKKCKNIYKYIYFC